MRFRDKKGRFTRGWHLSTKGYPRYHLKPYRNRYVHRVKMEQYLGRKLNKDEDVHHRNGNKLDFRRRNLQLLSHIEHGYISAKQHWFMDNVVGKREFEWYKEFGLVDDVPREILSR